MGHWVHLPEGRAFNAWRDSVANRLLRYHMTVFALEHHYVALLRHAMAKLWRNAVDCRKWRRAQDLWTGSARRRTFLAWREATSHSREVRAGGEHRRILVSPPPPPVPSPLPLPLRPAKKKQLTIDCHPQKTTKM